MAEELLDGLEVPRRVENALPGRVASLVHPLAGGDALGDDSGPLQTPVPPDAVNGLCRLR